MSQVENVNRKQWNHIVVKNNSGVFYSWEWARAKELCGEEVLMFFINNEELSAAIPVFVRKAAGILRFGWIPEGLIYSGNDEFLFSELKRFAKTHKLCALLTRITSVNNHRSLNGKFYALPWTKVKETFLLNLEEEENKLLAKMNSSTRNNINRADREGVQIQPFEQDDIQSLWKFYENFAEQKGFRPTGSVKLLEHLFIFSMDNTPFEKLKVAGLKSVHNGQIYGFIIAFKFGYCTREHIRADVQGDRIQSCAAKRLTWGQLKKAKESGAKTYDFGGVDRKGNVGVFDFKKSFGGELIRSSKIMLCPTLI